MLRIIVPETELFDQSKGEFFTLKSQTIVMEHSLVSISKWESKWKKPYLNNKDKTVEEELDYLRCMTITQNVDPIVYRFMPSEIYQKIVNYINDPMTATTIKEPPNRKGGSRQIVTNELIYYWMTIFNIPVEFEKWHINRLLTLIKICEIKQQDPQKMSKAQILASNAALNRERKKKYNTKG